MFEVNNILYIIALVVLGLFLSIILSYNKQNNSKEMGLISFLFLSSFLSKLVLLYINLELGIFEEKFAGSRAIELYSYYFEGNNIGSVDFINSIQNFWPQMVLSFAGLKFFGVNQINLNITNCFLSSILGCLLFNTVKNIFSRKQALFFVTIISFYPAVINYSIFGLRDISIYFFEVIYVVFFIKILGSNKKKSTISDIIILLVSGFGTLYARPELLVVVLGLPGIFVSIKLFKGVARIRQKQVRYLNFFLVSLIIASGIFVSGLFIYTRTIAQIGVDELVSPVVIIEEEGQKRYDRQFTSEGGGAGETASAIVPAWLYSKTNAVTRVPIQVFGMILIPYPWLLTKISRIYALLDSILIIHCVSLAIKGYKIRHTMKTYDRYLFLSLGVSFAIGITAFGMLVNNAGNAFRMRIALAPYLFAAVIFFDYYNQKSIRISNTNNKTNSNDN